MTSDSNYNSPLRDQAKQATRQKILDAVVRVVLDDGIHAFSVANVATRAGISHRTVYRHFASREELLEGLGEWLDAGPVTGPAAGLPPALPDLPGHAIDMFAALAAMREPAEAEIITAVALRHTMRGKARRWEMLKALIEATCPALSAEEHLGAAAALRAMLSSNAWFHTCVQLGVGEEIAARELSRAATLFIEDLARRNAAATTTVKQGRNDDASES